MQLGGEKQVSLDLNLAGEDFRWEIGELEMVVGGKRGNVSARTWETHFNA